MNERPQSSPPDTTGPKRLSLKAAAAIVALFLVVVALLIGYPGYKTYLAPWREPVLTVGDTTVTMRDYVKALRLHMNDDEKDKMTVTMRLLEEIQNDEIIRQEALRRNLTLPPEAVDKEIKRRVLETGGKEDRFEQLYENMLRGLRLSAHDFEKQVRLSMYRGLLLASFKKEVPEAAEQIRVFVIVVGTAKKAEAIRLRLTQGEDFSRVAEKESIDLGSSKKGGELGWLPRGVSDPLEAHPQVRAMGILVKTKEEAELVRKKLMAGEDFSKLAKTYSIDDESRPSGGDLGWVSTDYSSGGKQFAAESYDLEPGALSEPISAGEGYWVIKLLEKAPGGNIIDDIAFKMTTSQTSPPLLVMGSYYLIRVAERDPKRPLTEEHRQVLAERALNAWLKEQSKQGADSGRIKWNWGSESFNWAVAHLK